MGNWCMDVDIMQRKVPLRNKKEKNLIIVEVSNIKIFKFLDRELSRVDNKFKKYWKRKKKGRKR